MSFNIKTTALFGAALLLNQVTAHGFVSGILAGGKYYPGQSHYSKDPSAGWLADNGDNGFASTLTGPDIICHNNAKAGTQYVAVTAGESIELQWNTWPDSHKGPMIDYLAPCGSDCQTIDKTSLKFTKIDEAGLITGGQQGSQKWASDEMLANNFTWVTTIPSSIAPGKYVLRHETIALHSAGNAGGAQAYPQCINIQVSGSGSNSLSSGTVGTSLYKADDAGILINIYQNLQSYKIPGPAVMAGGGSGGSGSNPTQPGTLTGSTGGSSTTGKVTTSVKAAASSTKASASSTKVNAVSTTAAGNGPSKPSVTTTIGGKKYVCYEEA